MSTTAHLVIYDGNCPMCTFQMRALSWLDWFRCLRFVPSQDPSVAEHAPGVAKEELDAAIHLASREGRLYRGARALRFACLRVPPLIPVALVLWVPGVIWIAERAYDFVSKRRYKISKLFGCKGACKVLPERRSAKSPPRETAEKP